MAEKKNVVVIDSYKELAKYFDIKELYRFGLEHTIFVAPEEAKAQAVERWTAWGNNDGISIRKSKRKDKFKAFYKKGLGKDVEVEEDNKHFRGILEKEMGIKKSALQNFQCTHIFGRTSNPILASSVWNMAFSPNVVAAMTDEGNMSEGKIAMDYHALLQGVVWKLYEKMIRDYESRAAAVLQSVNPAGDAHVPPEEAQEEWIIPSASVVLSRYEELCGDMKIAPDFAQDAVTLDGKETNAIRIRFSGKNERGDGE